MSLPPRTRRRMQTPTAPATRNSGAPPKAARGGARCRSDSAGRSRAGAHHQSTNRPAAAGNQTGWHGRTRGPSCVALLSGYDHPRMCSSTTPSRTPRASRGCEAVTTFKVPLLRNGVGKKRPCISRREQSVRRSGELPRPTLTHRLDPFLCVKVSLTSFLPRLRQFPAQGWASTRARISSAGCLTAPPVPSMQVMSPTEHPHSPSAR